VQAQLIQQKLEWWNWIRTFKISNGVTFYGGSLMVELLRGVWREVVRVGCESQERRKLGGHGCDGGGD